MFPDSERRVDFDGAVTFYHDFAHLRKHRAAAGDSPIGVKWRVCISDQIQLYRGLKIQAARVAVGPFILLDITFPMKVNQMNTPFDTTFLLNEKFAVGQPVSRKEDRSCCAARVVIQTI